VTDTARVDLSDDEIARSLRDAIASGNGRYRPPATIDLSLP